MKNNYPLKEPINVWAYPSEGVRAADKKEINMMRKMLLFGLLILMTGFVFGDKVGTLPELLKPDNLTIYGDQLYVVEGASIYIYSLKDLKLVRKFGKFGEGPGELHGGAFFPTRLTVTADHIVAETRAKVVFFSKDGKFIKETRKKNVFSGGFTPVGKNFVARRIQQDGNVSYNCIDLFDADLKRIKELYRQKWVQQGRQEPVKMYMVMDFANYTVYRDKIFIEQSPDGFRIEVFDMNGKSLYKIDKEYEKIKLTAKNKEDMLYSFKNDPVIKVQAERAGGWKQFKNFFDFAYPGTFPAIRDMMLSDGKIYIRTYKVTGDNGEYLLMDLTGDNVKRVSAPEIETVPLMARILGSRLHAMAQGKLYYLKENEEEEEWDLYADAVK